MNQMGTCRFCGQQSMIVVGKELSEEEINELATMECKCLDAREYQCRKDSVTAAEAWIDSHDWNDETVELFKKAAGAVIDKQVDRVTVKKDDFNYTIKINGEGHLTISQKQTISGEERF